MPSQKIKSKVGKGKSATFVKIVHLKAIPRPTPRSFATVDEAVEFILTKIEEFSIMSS